MPHIRFIRLTCGCGAEHKVRLEEVADKASFECVSCGHQVETAPYVDVLDMIYQYSSLILKLEERFSLDGDVAVLLEPRPSRKLTTW